MKLPFWIMPGSWGLKGDTRNIAEAEYYLEGEELDKKIASIKYKDNQAELDKELIKIDFKYQKISEYERDKALLEIDNPSDKEKRLLEIELKHGKITQKNYEKSLCTLNNEPWVGVLNSEFEATLDGSGGFSLEMDWNHEFIVYLKANGYSGDTESDIVDKWISDIWRESAKEEITTLPLAGRRPFPV